jgi:uncharacterized protein (TIGR00251 family)
MTLRVPVRETAEGASFLVRVAPRAGRTAIVGVLGDGKDAAVKIALQAPPLEGRANAALIDFLAELLGVARSAIAVVSGEHTRTKRIAVRGRDAMEVATAIAIALTQ